ncbi:hypothetical protein CPB85DRAFT_1300147 [Mucidula mucida]|nr:hypothetical protein CPB85DRAFT_1300147 [Mucidula mucida]
MTIRAMQTGDSENMPFPGPLHIPDEKSFLHMIPEAEEEELDAQLLDYTNFTWSNPFSDPVHDAPEVKRAAPGRKHRRRSSRRILPPRFRAPGVTPTFTDSWCNRYSTQTYVNEVITEIRESFLEQTGEIAPMDVDPPEHTQSTPLSPPGIHFGKDYYASAVAKMMLNRSDAKRKRTWCWQYRPSRLGCEVTVL